MLRPFDSCVVTRPLKHIAPLVSEKVDAVPATGRYIGLEQIASWQGALSETQLMQQPEGAANVFSRGDVVFGKLRPYLAKAWVADTPGFCTTEGLVLRPTNGDPRFVRYCLLTNEAISSIDGSTYGSKMPRADWSFIGALHLPYPAPDEQEHIANFLDDKTARIDALIAEKNELHALVEEEKQACIDNALFGGLQPPENFPFVPVNQTIQGVEWSRCMLKHKWRVTDCKHLTVEFRDAGYALASIREVSGAILNLVNAKRASEEDYRSLIEGGREPKRGDLIYARNASVGASALVDTDEPFSMGQDVCLITSPDQDQAFLRLQLMSTPLKAQLESLLQGATIRRINVEQIRSFSLFVPPVPVQHEVVSRARGALERREHLQRHIAEHIARLREYRSSLISAAVTGQLDVGSFEAAKA